VISPTQRPLPDNTQHSQTTNIHVPGGIRTRNPSNRVAAQRGHWDRQVEDMTQNYRMKGRKRKEITRGHVITLT
jgi:hypothetical protein